MKCKFCNAQMDENSTVCPACGKENNEETEVLAQSVPAQAEAAASEGAPDAAPAQPEVPARKRGKGFAWKIAAAVCCVLVLLAVLTYALLKSFGVEIKLPANDIYRKTSYSVDAAGAKKTVGKVIATIGDKKLTNGDLQVYYWSQVTDFIESSISNGGYTGISYAKPLDQQTSAYDSSKTWQQVFLEAALEYWQRYQVLALLGQEAGLELDAELAEHLRSLPEDLEKMAETNGYESLEQMLTESFGPGVTVENYVNFVRVYYEAMQYYNHLYESLDPTVDELEDYYRANAAYFQQYGITQESGKLVDTRHILVKPEGGTTDENGNVVYSEEEMTACYEKAKGIYDTWKAGEATEESFGQLANLHSADGGSNTNGGLYTRVSKGQFVEDYNGWLFDDARKPGDSDLVRSRFGWHIVYYVSGEDAWITYTRSNFIGEKISNTIDEGIAAWPMKVKYSGIALGEVSLLDAITGGTGSSGATEGTEPAESTDAPE